ncbi:unnamed protein product [Closterium sp. NIES-53]
MIRQYPDIFPDDLPPGLPPERPEDHKIQLEPGAQPTIRTQWRLTQPELEELRSQIDALLEKGFIRASTSPFAAPILFTPKKDGGLRMCIDYRALNWVTIKSRYPIPRTDALLDQLRGARYFSKIDLLGGYHQIRVFADDCHMAAFRTRYGSYEFTVMPFGLTNAPSTFQLTMNRVFRDLLDRCDIVYLDDILIFSKTREDHLCDLDAVFKRLQENRLITEGSMCKFFKQELEFLGHVISRDGIKIDPAKIKTIQEWKPPTIITKLQILLGFVNYVRRFIPNMAGITGPLTDLLHKDKNFVWGKEAEAAFQELKNFLVSPPVLCIADPSRPFKVVTDASDFAIGAVLLQDFGNGLQPIAYESRKLQAAERNYPIHDKEMLAIIHAFKLWRCYLVGADVTVRTDHKSLQYLRAQPNLNPAGVAIFDLDYDAILAAMYALSTSDEGDCYLCLPPDPGGGAAALGACEAAALGASASAAPGAGESALSGTASAQVFHTFTLDSGASRSFFRDRTTLTPLSRPVAVSLADSSGGPNLASFSTVLPCPAAPSGTLSGLYLPSFSTNLVSGADLQDQGVDQFTPATQRVTHCTCARTGRHLATFTRRPGSSMYTLSTESPPVPPSVCALLVSSPDPPDSPLAPPPWPTPTCVPCVEGRQRAAPHSSAFPPTEAPLQTLHMDVWGPARVRGQGHERYFLLVVDDYSRYTTVFPLRSKGDVTEVLIDSIRAARLQLRESFGSDFPVLRLHSDRGGEFSSSRLGAFCRARGIRQTFTLPASPQQNGIAERRIGMVMDVARTSMIHAAAPHFLWPFAVQYAAHQLNLQPRVSVPETSPTLRWTEKVGDASVFRVWGSRAFVRGLSADKLSPRAVPCVFLGFPPDVPGWQFYHPTSRRVLSSQDVTFDESVPYYRLFPYRTAPLPPPPLFLVPGPPPVDPLPPQGPAPSGVSQVDAVEPVEVVVDSGAGSTGAEPGGAGSGGAAPGGAESGGAEPGGAESEGAEPGSAEPGGEEPGGAGSARVASRGASSRRELLSPQELREWFARRRSHAAGAGGTPGAARTGGAAAAAGVGSAGASGAAAAGGTGAAGPAGVGPAGASGATGAGAAGGVSVGGSPDAGPSAGAGVGAVGAGGAAGASAAAEGTGAVPAGSGDPARPRPYFVPLLEQVLGLPPSSGPAPSLECPQPVQSQSLLQPVSPLPAPSPYTGPTGGLAERRESSSRPASPVRAARTSGLAPRQRPPAVPRTHQMALRPSTASQRVPLPSPPASSLPILADPESDSLRAASPTVTRLLSTVVTDPSFESTAASTLVAELVDFAACCRLDYAAGLVAESASVSPPSVGGECALSTDVLEDRQEEFQCFTAALPHLVSMMIAPEGDLDAPDIPTPRSYAEAIEGPYSSQWQSAMDAEMASWKSTGTYVDEVPPPGANIVSGMWIFRGVDYFHTFSSTSKMTTLRVLLHVAAQGDYELHSLDFSTAFLQGSLHEEIWLRRPPGFTGSFPPGTQWSLRRPVYGLRQAPREWHDTLRTTLAALGFAPSTADPSLFLRTDTSLPPFYILVYVDDLVFATADTAGLAHVKSELQKRHTCTDLARTSPACDSLAAPRSPRAAPAAQRAAPAAVMPPLHPCAPPLQARPSALLPRELPLAASPPLVGPARRLCCPPRSPETSVVNIGAARGTPCTPFFEGCSPSPLAPSYASAATVDILGAEDVGAASTIQKRRSSKGKGGRGGGGGTGGGGGGSTGGGGGSGGGGGVVGVVVGVGALAEAVVAAVGVAVVAAVGVVAVGLELLSGEVLAVARGSSSSVGARPRDRAGQSCGKPHTQHCYFSRLKDAWRAELGDEAERPRWAELLRSGVAIFDLDYFAILAAMYALSVSSEGDCYLCVPPDPGIEAAALGASKSALPHTAPAEALHTFTLDSGASRFLARSSTVLPCPALPSGSLSGLQLPSFSTNLVSTDALQDAMVTTTTPGGRRVYADGPSPSHVHSSAWVESGSTPFSCRLLSHQTLLWHHRLGHPSLPRLCGMRSRLLVSGLLRSVPTLPHSPAPPCLPCVKGRQRAAPHSSSFLPPTAPLQALHMDVLDPARVSRQGRGRYFLLVVDDYTRYTMVFLLRSKGEVPDDLIRAVRFQLRERFRQDLPVLCLHSDRGGEFSSDLLRDFSHGEGILKSFTLPASPHKNGIAEHRIGLVMEVTRTSMIHAVAPHFLWPFAVRYAAHQLNLWPRVSLPETSPTLRWTGKVGDASVFQVWGSRAFVRDTCVDKLSARTIPCVFLGFPPDAPGWQFYHPTSHCVIPSQDVTFDELVPFYCLFPYRSAPPRPPPLFLAPGPPTVDPPPPPRSIVFSGVSQVDRLLGNIAGDSGAAQGAASGGAASGGAEPGGAETGGAEFEGAWSGGAEPGGAEPAGVKPGGAEPEGVEPGGAESKGAESGGVEPRRTASFGGPAGASPRLSPRPEPLSPQQLREWFAQRTRLRSGAAGAGDSAIRDTRAGGVGATRLGGAGVTGGAGGTGGAAAADPEGARIKDTGAVGTGSVGGAGAGGSGVGDLAESGGAGAGGTSAGGAGAGGARAGDPGAGGTGAGGTGAGVRAVHPGAGGARSGGAMSGGTGAGGTVRPRPYSVPLLQQVLGLPSSPVLTPPLLCPPPNQSQPPLQPASPLPAPSPYTEQTEGLTEHREPESRPASPVCAVRTGRRVPRPRPPPVLGTLAMALRPSSVPLRVPLPPPLESSLPAVPDLVSDLACAASPTVSRLLATVVTDPSFDSTAASTLVAELEDFECLAAAIPHFASILLPLRETRMHQTFRPRALTQRRLQVLTPLIGRQPWMLRWPPGSPQAPTVKRPPGSPHAFKARYVARGFSQRQGVDYFQIFSPNSKMTTLRVLLHVAAQRDYELHSLDFSTAFLQGSLHEEICLRRPIYALRQAPREWHDTLRTTLAALGFTPLTTDSSLFLRTDTSLPPFYALVHVDDLVFATADTEALPLVKSELQKRHTCTDLEPSGPYPELVGCLIYLMTCIRPDLAYSLSLLARYVAPGRHRKVHWDTAKRVLRYLCSTSGMGLMLGGRGPAVLSGHADASWVDNLATQRSSLGYTFSLGSDSVSWRSTRSSSVLSSSCEAEIYERAMAAQELRWLTYLLTDLGEQPRSPPVLYVDNKAMIALCQEHRLEHKTKHIALRYFLA